MQCNCLFEGRPYSTQHACKVKGSGNMVLPGSYYVEVQKEYGKESLMKRLENERACEVQVRSSQTDCQDSTREILRIEVREQGLHLSEVIISCVSKQCDTSDGG